MGRPDFEDSVARGNEDSLGDDLSTVDYLQFGSIEPRNGDYLAADNGLIARHQEQKKSEPVDD